MHRTNTNTNTLKQTHSTGKVTIKSAHAKREQQINTSISKALATDPRGEYNSENSPEI